MAEVILEKSSEVKAIKDEVKNISSNISNIIKELDPSNSLISQTSRLSKFMDESKLIISVVGAFSRGKSCFINSLLGKEVLAEDAGETTATITFIEFGEKPQLRVKYRDKRPDFIVENVDPREYVKIIKDETSKLSEKYNDIADIIEEVLILYPSDILKDGVKIVDTPGIGGLSGYTAMTEAQIKISNAAICLFSFSASGGDATEVKFLKSVKEEMNNETKKLLYIANQAYLNELSEESFESKYRERNNIDENEELFLSDLEKKEFKDKVFKERREKNLNLFKDTINTHLGLERDKINIFAYDSKWAISKNEDIKKRSNFELVTKHIDEVLTSDDQMIEAHLFDPIKKITKILDETKLLINKRLEEYDDKDTLSQLNERLGMHKEKEITLKEKLENQQKLLKQNLYGLSITFKEKFEKNILAYFDSFITKYNKNVDDIESQEDINELEKKITTFFDEIQKKLKDYIENNVKDEIESKLLEYENNLKNDLSNEHIFNSDSIDKIINEVKLNFDLFESINFNKLGGHLNAINNNKNMIKEIESEISKKQKDLIIKIANKHQIEKELNNLKFDLEKTEGKIKFLGNEPDVVIIPGQIITKQRAGVWGQIKDLFLDPLKVTLPDTKDDRKLRKFNETKSKLEKQLDTIENNINDLKKDNTNIDLEKNVLDEYKETKNKIEKEIENSNKKIKDFWGKTKEDLKEDAKNKLDSMKGKMETAQKRLTVKAINDLSSRIETETIKTITEKLEDQNNEIKRLQENISKTKDEKEVEIKKIDSLKVKIESISNDISNLEKKAENLRNK